MKILLTALLIVLVFGCNGGKRYETIIITHAADTITIYNGTVDIGRTVSHGHNDTITNTFTIEIGEHDTAYLKRMQELLSETDQNHLDSIYMDDQTISPPKPSPLPDTTKPLNIKMQPRWRTEDAGLYVFREAPIQVTDMTGSKPTDILLVCDTSTANGFLSNRVYWIYGYAGYSVDGNSRIYLDQEGKKLPKNIVVFLSKELK